MKETKVRQFFDDTQNYLHRDFGVRIRADIVKALIQPKAMQILDSGCGDGGVSVQFLQHNQVVFLDISDKMLALVHQRIPKEFMTNATLLNKAISDFQPDYKFDFILAIGLLAHVPSVEDFIIQVRRMLKDGGDLVLQFSDSRSWITQLNFRLAKRYSYQLNRISADTLMSVIDKNGFSLQKEIRFGLQLPGMGLLPNRLLYWYSKFVLKSGLGRLFGSERIWKIRYNHV